MFPPLHFSSPLHHHPLPFPLLQTFFIQIKIKKREKASEKKRFKNKKNQESEISHDRQRKKKRKGRKAIFLDFSAANDVVLLRIPEIYCHNPTYARCSNGGDDGGRKRITLVDAIEKSGDRRTLETILSMEKQPGQANQTLMDIIRDEESGSLFGHRDKKSWKAFRDKLRLKRAGSAWTSSVHTPTSDIPIPVENRFRNSNINNASTRSLMARRNSVRFTTVSSVIQPELEESDDNSGMGPSSRPQMTRRSSTRFGSAIPQVQSESTHSGDSDVNIHEVDDGPPSRRFRAQISRHNSTRFPAVDPTQSDENDSDPSSPEGTTRLGTALAEERLLSAREAVAAQEAAEAAAQAEAAAAAAAEQEAEEGAMPMPGNMETQEPVRMSLMDLLEETDRQMGFEGSRYTMGDLEACDDDDDEEEEEEEDRGDGGAVIEYTCCVCMVRHKGAAFIPCGHTFCRLCSRELWVQRGNCPLCNGFISEILDIF